MTQPIIGSSQAHVDSPIKINDKFDNNPQVTKERLPNWTEHWFKKGNHRYYKDSANICLKDNSSCTVKSLVKIMNKMSAYPNQVKEFIPGQKHIGDVDIEGPWDIDHVSSTAIYKNKVQIGIRNETLRNHKMFYGVVERTISERNGSLFVKTVGGGNGENGGPNIWLVDYVWDPVDRLLINEYHKTKGKR